MKLEPVAVTTQEAVDGHCEKAMTIASVDHGSGALVGKAIEPLGRSVDTQSGWMELEKTQPPDSRQALV